MMQDYNFSQEISLRFRFRNGASQHPSYSLQGIAARDVHEVLV